MFSKLLTGKPTGKTLGKPGCCQEDKIRMDPKQMSINKRNWIDSAQDMDYWRTLEEAALSLRVP